MLGHLVARATAVADELGAGELAPRLLRGSSSVATTAQATRALAAAAAACRMQCRDEQAAAETAAMVQIGREASTHPLRPGALRHLRLRGSHAQHQQDRDHRGLHVDGRR